MRTSTQPHSSRGISRRLLSFAALTLTLALFLVENVGPAWDAKAFDLSALAVAGEVVRETGFAHLYDHDANDYNVAASDAYVHAARAIGFDDVPTPFVYPALVAYVARGLAAAPYAWVARTWCVASVLFVAAGLVIGVAYFAPGFVNGPWSIAIVTASLVLFEPIRYALWLGQTTPLVFLCVMVSFVVATRRPRTAGVALAVAAFVKITPVLFVAPWLLLRRYRACASFACALGVLAVLSVAVAGVDCNAQFLRRLHEISGETVVSFNNLGLFALIERCGEPTVDLMTWQVVHPAATTRAAALFAGAAMTLLGALALRRVVDADRERLAQSLITSMMLLLPPIAWTHYWLFLVPPVVGCGWMVYQAGHRAVALSTAVLTLALCSRPFVIDHITHARSAVTLIVGPTIAAGLLFVLSLATCYRTGSTRAKTTNLGDSHSSV